MKQRSVKLLFLFIFLLLLALIAHSRPDWQSIEVDGRQRRYIVQPSAKRFTGKRPLLLVFHGGGGNARQARGLGFSKACRTQGYIVVYPDGVDGHWYDPRVAFYADDGSRPDDLKFVSKLLDKLESDYPIDTDRIYATGLSNGGIMSHYVGEALSERIAAIAPVIGGIPLKRAEAFAPQSPVSVLIMQGTKDPLVPYNGGHITVFGKKRGQIVSTERAVDMWVKSNGCKTDGKNTALPDPLDDGCSIERTSYTGGESESEVILYTVHGGGHTIPGGSQYLPKRLIGTVCQDINGVDVILDFFSKHRKVR